MQADGLLAIKGAHAAATQEIPEPRDAYAYFEA